MTFKYYLIAFLAFSQAVPFQGICREYPTKIKEMHNIH